MIYKMVNKQVPDVLAEYKEKIKNLLVTNNVNEVRIGGSFGRNDSNYNSDIDVWFIVKSLPTLPEIVELSNEELLVRHNLGKKYNYPNFDRHYCTILSQIEADFYEEVFPARVGVPRFLGETISLWGQSKIITKTSTKSDIIVSLKEFENTRKQVMDKGRSDLSRKYARRTLRELYFYRDNKRFVSDKSVDEIIKSTYEDNDEKVFVAARVFVNQLSSASSKEAIYHRDLSHRLMFTLEKVRWELVYGLTNKIDYINWVQEKKKYYAFFPSEIIQLITEASSMLGVEKTEEIFLLNEISTKSFSTDLIYQFHDYHTKWMLNNAKLDLKRYNDCAYVEGDR